MAGAGSAAAAAASEGLWLPLWQPLQYRFTRDPSKRISAASTSARASHMNKCWWVGGPAGPPPLRLLAVCMPAQVPGQPAPLMPCFRCLPTAARCSSLMASGPGVWACAGLHLRWAALACHEAVRSEAGLRLPCFSPNADMQMNIADVGRGLGVCSVLVPNGLTADAWRKGLAQFARQRANAA